MSMAIFSHNIIVLEDKGCIEVFVGFNFNTVLTHMQYKIETSALELGVVVVVNKSTLSRLQSSTANCRIPGLFLLLSDMVCIKII